MSNDTYHYAFLRPPSVSTSQWTNTLNMTSSTEQPINSTERYGNVTSQAGGDVQGGPDMFMRFVCETAISMPIAVGGTVGNLLAFIVLWRQKQYLSTTLLLQSLAVTDTSVLLTTIFLRCLRYLYYHTEAAWLVGYMEVYPYIFRWLYPLVYFLRLTDTWLTVLLTIDRFIAVRHPLHAQGTCTLPRAIKNMIVLIFAAFIFSFPRFFEHGIDLKSEHGFSQTPLLENRLYTIAYRIVLFSVLMYVVPLILLVVLNTWLLRTLKAADSYRANVTELKLSRPNRSITAMVVAVVIITILCNVTAMLTHLVWALQQCFSHLSHLETPRRYLAQISNIFVTFNSAINFAIYCLCSRNFRLTLVRIYRCNPVRGPLQRSSKQSSSRTSRTTYISMTHASLIRKKPSTPLITEELV